MGKEKVLLRSDHNFCDSFLQGELDRLKKDNNRDNDKQMKEDRPCKTECSSFKIRVIFEDGINLLFSF
jgi:hypothetical protein